MKKKLLFTIIITCWLFMSCSESVFVSTIYGAKKPKTETEISIHDWVQKYGFSGVQVYSITPDMYYNTAINGYASSFRIYSKLGSFLSIGYSEGKYFCPKNFDDYLRTIQRYENLHPKPDNYLIFYSVGSIPIGKKISRKELDALQHTAIADTVYPTIKEINSFIRDLQGNKVQIPDNYLYDYTLVLPFSLFNGNRMQVSELTKYYKAAMENPNARFQVILLNFDKQEWWGKEWNEQINISHR